ncbi:MAG TPA: ADP-polyphosphate phosphotransferase [Steroidobacteraceae bacterium]|nr:ADP-polyphosphate phosphotransferase [Steroidobacteraceae bacterium]
MKILCSDYRVKPGDTVQLQTWPTAVKRLYGSKSDYEALLQTHVEELQRLQSLLYACNQYAILIIFQGMDTAGKDGAIKHVMSGVNPQGCQVFSFKHPSAEELEHDFLWRTTRCLPERGLIGIFNRSYYEEVLIVRVHREILAAEHLPDEPGNAGTDIWTQRFRSIADLEAHLHRNGTRIVKFFLHIGPEEQRRRLLERIDNPHKNWKLSLADVEERRHWNEYLKAYEKCLAATSTAHAPWYVVPADDKKNARLIVSSVLHETLRGLKMSYPKLSAPQRRELKKARKLLNERPS